MIFLYASTPHENTSQYQCTIGLTVDCNKAKYQIGYYCFVEKQILRTKTARSMKGKKGTFGKITIETWGVEG